MDCREQEAHLITPHWNVQKLGSLVILEPLKFTISINHSCFKNTSLRLGQQSMQAADPPLSVIGM